MNHEDEPDAGLPVACTLTAGELAKRRDGLLPGLLAKAVGSEPIAGGYRWRFAFDGELVTEVAAVIAAEHRCCRFIRFVLIVQPGDGPMLLEATGPEGTAEFLSPLMSANPSSGG